jgi:hypothetical protein
MTAQMMIRGTEDGIRTDGEIDNRMKEKESEIERRREPGQGGKGEESG